MRYIALAFALLCTVPAAAQQNMLWMYVPTPIPQPTVSLDFRTNAGMNGSTSGTAASFLTVARTQTGNTTDLLPSSPPTPVASIKQFAANTARITPGQGLLLEGQRTALLLNSTAPATQTTGSMAVGTYTLWVNGSGSAAVSAGTGVGCSGTASQGTPATVTITTAGTCVVTVTGSLNAFQLELGGWGSSLIVTAAATVTRPADVVTMAVAVPTPVAYSAYFQALHLSAPSTVNQSQIQIDDGTNTNRSAVNRILTSSVLQLFNSGGTAGLGTGLLANQGVPLRFALANTTSYQAAAQDGASAAIIATAFTPSAVLTTLRLGGNATANAAACYCYLAVVKEWPASALTAQQLQQITQWGSGS